MEVLLLLSLVPDQGVGPSPSKGQVAEGGLGIVDTAVPDGDPKALSVHVLVVEGRVGVVQVVAEGRLVVVETGDVETRGGTDQGLGGVASGPNVPDVPVDPGPKEELKG